MRIRTIKPEFFTHEGLYELEKETGLPIRVAFSGLWCVADKAGRFKWEPRRIGVSVLPYDGIDFSRVLDALFTRGYLLRYRVDSIEYGAIPSFAKHQFINNKEKESDLPVPMAENEISSEEGKVKEGESKGRRVKDACATREARVTDIISPLFELSGFSDEWDAFINHRKKLKKPLTERAIELTMRKLEIRPAQAMAALQMAMEKGWQSIEWEWFDRNRPQENQPAGEPWMQSGKIGAYDAPRTI